MTSTQSIARRAVLAVAALLILAGAFTATPALACGGPCPTNTPTKEPKPTEVPTKPPKPTEVPTKPPAPTATKPPAPTATKPPIPLTTVPPVATKVPPIATPVLPSATKVPLESTKEPEPTKPPVVVSPGDNDNRSRSRSQRRDDNENDGDEDNQNEGQPATRAQPARQAEPVYVQPIYQERTTHHAPLVAPEPAPPAPIDDAPASVVAAQEAPVQIDNPPAGPVYVPAELPKTGDGSTAIAAQLPNTGGPSLAGVALPAVTGLGLVVLSLAFKAWRRWR